MAKRKTSRAIRKIVVISDIHAGSTKALVPPGFTTLEGNKISFNAMQEWLWMCWCRKDIWLDQILDGEPFALVINGDVTEGNHHHTKEIWSPETLDHLNAAVELLKPLADRASKVFVVTGTECHTNNMEHSVAKILGAEKDHATGNSAFDRLTIDLNGVRHVFRHHIGTTVRRGLAGTQLSANLAEEQVEAVTTGSQSLASSAAPIAINSAPTKTEMVFALCHRLGRD